MANGTGSCGLCVPIAIMQGNCLMVLGKWRNATKKKTQKNNSAICTLFTLITPIVQFTTVALLETFRNATLTVTVTVRRARRLWRHRIVCIWNAPNRRPNRKCQHMTVSGADNRMRFTVSGYAKFHQIFRENDIDLFYFNKQLSKFITHW